MKGFWLFIVIWIFADFITDVVNSMSKDGNTGIRLLGYVIAIVSAYSILWLVLFYYFGINLTEMIALYGAIFFCKIIVTKNLYKFIGNNFLDII